MHALRLWQSRIAQVENRRPHARPTELAHRSWIGIDDAADFINFAADDCRVDGRCRDFRMRLEQPARIVHAIHPACTTLAPMVSTAHRTTGPSLALPSCSGQMAARAHLDPASATPESGRASRIP